MIDGQRHESRRPRYTGSPSQQPTPSRILTPSLSRGKAHPRLSFCSRNRRPPSGSSCTWLPSRGHPRCPNFYRLFSLFWPASLQPTGANDFNPSRVPSLSRFPPPLSRVRAFSEMGRDVGFEEWKLNGHGNFRSFYFPFSFLFSFFFFFRRDNKREREAWHEFENLPVSLFFFFFLVEGV